MFGTSFKAGISETLEGGNEGDEIDGGGGNDTLLGGNGIDLLLGGAGEDRLQGNDGSDTLLGGEGVDLVCDEEDADILEGGPGADYLFWTGLSTAGASGDAGTDGAICADPGFSWTTGCTSFLPDTNIFWGTCDPW